MSAAAALPAASDDPSGHNTLASFHTGCRCGWCQSASLERCCGCPPCTRMRQKCSSPLRIHCRSGGHHDSPLLRVHRRCAGVAAGGLGHEADSYTRHYVPVPVPAPEPVAALAAPGPRRDHHKDQPAPASPDLPTRGQTCPSQQLPRQETRRPHQHPPHRPAHDPHPHLDTPSSMIRWRIPVRSFASCFLRVITAHDGRAQRDNGQSDGQRSTSDQLKRSSPTASSLVRALHQIVGRLGLEPRTDRLKVCSSTH